MGTLDKAVKNGKQNKNHDIKIWSYFGSVVFSGGHAEQRAMSLTSLEMMNSMCLYVESIFKA